MTLSQTLAGGFARPQLEGILGQACARIGLGAEGAALLRGHSNAVVRLTSAPVVVKIARRGTAVEDTARTVRFAGWLEAQDFPTVPLHPGVDQPQVIDGHAVTYWTYIPQDDCAVTAAQLGEPLRLLHALPHPPEPLPSLDVIAPIRASLRATTALNDDELALLHHRADHLEREYARAPVAGPHVVLHGDPQHRNALNSVAGTLLCDWDSAIQGPAEWDLVTVEVHCRRFGYEPSHYSAFANAYGRDIREWEGYPVLRDIRELRMIATNARKAQPGPTLDEVRRRVQGLRAPDPTTKWRIL